MISHRRQSGINSRTRSAPDTLNLFILLAPALVVVLCLFGGGLVLGVMQSFGYMPAAGMDTYTPAHFYNILLDPDFFKSLALTLYISIVSTVLAAGCSIAIAVLMASLSGTRRVLDFIFQIPLTVPHLVVAIAFGFMLAPTGMFSRFFQTIGLISDSSRFPLLINDSWCIGIILTYVWKEIPFITLMVLSVLKNTGTELMDVGRTLKAGRWQRFKFITLPTIFPSLGAASLIVFAYTFGAFEVPYLLGQTYPMTLPLWAYRNYSDIDLLARPEGIATGVIITIVIVFAIVLAQLIARSARQRGVIL